MRQDQMTLSVKVQPPFVTKKAKDAGEGSPEALAFEKFQKDGVEALNWLVRNFDDLECYLNETTTMEGHPGIGFWHSSCTEAPIFLYWRPGLKEVKC